LECGSLLPLWLEPACWLGIVLAVEIPAGKGVAIASAVLTVGFSHAPYPSGKRTSPIWMGHAAAVALS